MRKRYHGNKGEFRALRTYVKLMRAAESVTARTHRHLYSTGLTISQFAVLEALYHSGPLSQREIGQKNPQKQRQYYDGDRQPRKNRTGEA